MKKPWISTIQMTSSGSASLFEGCIRTGKPYAVTARLGPAHGQEVTVEARGIALRTADAGEIKGVVGVFRDLKENPELTSDIVSQA